jgi:hypothetical protein
MTMGLFSLGKRNNRDLMRESAAMTTVYLLEWNRKFEQFLRAKVADLEARVAAQQSRLSTQAETEAREVWATELPFDDFEDNFAAEAEPNDHLEDEPVAAEATPPVIEAGSAVPTSADFLSLLGGAPDDSPPEDAAPDAWPTELPAAGPEDDDWGV